MKTFRAVLVVVGCLSPSFSFATDCLAGFAENANFGELVALELDFGARLVANRSECTDSFKVAYTNIIDATCEVCGKRPAVGDQVIGKRRVTGKGTVTAPPAYPQFSTRNTYSYEIQLEEMTPGNPLVLRCYGETVRGHDYNLTDGKQALMVLSALGAASVKCAKPKIRASCF